jgi:transcriptional regulator with XRE-family HTH domain
VTIESAEITQRRLEQVLGLSAGYLSRVRAKRGDASAQLVSTLVLIAEDPKRRLIALDRAWQPAITVG